MEDILIIYMYENINIMLYTNKKNLLCLIYQCLFIYLRNFQFDFFENWFSNDLNSHYY